MTFPIKVSVGTDALRELLMANPEVYTQLEAMACEKIAEELLRKIAGNKSKFKKLLDDQIFIALGEIVSTYTAKFRFPKEAKAAIEDAVRLQIKQQSTTIQEEFRKEIGVSVSGRIKQFDREVSDMTDQAQRIIQQATLTAVEEMKANVLTLVDKQARASFIDVLREAKGATG